ncbi:MAG: homocysteine S-methyltransferase family protein [Ignavibacteria bacterium]|nr:homocysteine S-methyltransferase family protein [Ignavibacteria bacterium]
MGALKQLLSTGRTIILDSAMGTELQQRGVSVGLPLWSAQALIDKPDTVRHIHIDNIDTGADIITANTFRTQKRTYQKAGYSYNNSDFTDTAKYFTAEAVDIAKEAVMIAAEEDEVLVAGCIAPLEDSYKPEMTPDTDTLCTEHYEHMKNLAEAGVDLFLAETLTNIREISAVLNQLHKFDLDNILSITPKNDKELLSGEPISEAVNIINKFTPDILCVNCIHPQMAEAVLNFLKSVTEIPLGVYANIGDPNFKDGDQMKKTVLPDEYFKYAQKWKSMGVRLIGGCCGTNPLYIAKLNTLKNKK